MSTHFQMKNKDKCPNVSKFLMNELLSHLLYSKRGYIGIDNQYMHSLRRYDRLRREELKMKKSIAVILLGSALLLPNNNNVEASNLDKNVLAKKVQYIECVRWEDNKFDFSKIQLKKDSHFKLQYNWKALFNRYLEVTQPVPSKPIEESEVEVTPEVEKTPEVEVVPDDKPVPTPAPEVTPEVEQEKEQEPETKPVPEEAPTPVEPAPEKEQEQKPETKPVPEVTPAPTPTPVKPAPEKPAQPIEQPAKASISSIEQAVLKLTNAERQKAGLSPLQSDSKLMDSARAKSKDMSANRYFSHTSPTYGSPFDQMKSFGVSYRSAAENIAQGQRSAEEVVKAWMESPGHRQNILGANFTHIGIGYDANGNYWTQQFIQK